MSKPKRKHVESYESDDGFVEDAPKGKKQKSEPREKKEVSSEKHVDDDGNEYWEISGKRRVQISQFGKNIMINIREFYEKDGKMLPGKKGIALPIDQYTALIALLPDIEAALKTKDIAVPRPKYGKAGKVKAEVEDEDEDEIGQEDEAADAEEEEEEEEGLAARAEASTKVKSKLERFKMKRNHDATSDEDDG